MVDGVMYISAMDRAWAINARTGEQNWSYFFKTRGGHHFNGSKGMGMYGGWLYFVTPDAYLVSLDAKTGKERWYKQLAPVEMDYFCSTAPLVVGNHVYDGSGRRCAATFRACWKRAIPKRATCSGSGTRRRRIPAIPATIPGPTTTRASTAAAARGSRSPTIPISI